MDVFHEPNEVTIWLFYFHLVEGGKAKVITIHLNLYFESINSVVKRYCLDKFMDSYNFSRSECLDYCQSEGYSISDDLQKELDAPLPWIGMYIAAASAVISLAMAADALYGFTSRKYWFPCKYFSLNAFSLTLLAVAMKLPVDLTSEMLGVNDLLANASSLVLMTTAMSNFMTSLGSMESNEIMINLAALGIFVATITVNVVIHKYQMLGLVSHLQTLWRDVGAPGFMLLLLVMLFSLAIMVPTAKKYVESVYQVMHRRLVSNKKVEWGNFTADELRTMVRRHWVMAQSGSPQFVIARSVTCAMSGLLCLVMAISLIEAWIRMSRYPPEFGRNSSNYKWSIQWILHIQSIGVALGSIAPVFRWFFAAEFNSSKIGHRSFKEEFRVEDYWTQMLLDWRDSSFPVQIQHHKFKKLLNDAKRIVLNICIRVQVVIILVEKLFLLISARFVKVILLCFNKIKNLKAHSPEESRSTTMGHEFSPYVVLLEGEAELPKKTLINICNKVDKLIQVGKKKQTENLIKLLQKSANFSGVTEFDSKQVPSLHSHQETPNCWSLPIVTLTSIAVALPNIAVDKSNELLRAVSEGLYFVKIIEKALDRNDELASIRNAADVVWVGVELYHKWQDISLKSQCDKNVLQELSYVAKKTVEDFKVDVGDLLRENPLSWPVKVMAANSMYRISQTIMQRNKDNSPRKEELFVGLSIMISDILSACLTNIVTVIALKCQNSVIKEREVSVSQAAVLLGESQEILEILQQRVLPSLDQGKAAYIDEWKAVLEQDSENPEIYTSATSTTNPHANGEHISIELEG